MFDARSIDGWSSDKRKATRTQKEVRSGASFVKKKKEKKETKRKGKGKGKEKER